MAEDVTFLHGNNIYQNQFEILPVKWLKMGNRQTDGQTDGRHTPFLKQLHFVAAKNITHMLDHALTHQDLQK